MLWLAKAFKMNKTNYSLMYQKIFNIIGGLTPIKADCGTLCDGACCKGDENTGMLLFPFEETSLLVRELSNGHRLAVCNGECDRDKRPLSCRIFPFFPTVNEKGKIIVRLDVRAYNICPLVCYADNVKFDKRFIRAVKKAGKILKKDPLCVEFLRYVTDEINSVEALNGDYL